MSEPRWHEVVRRILAALAIAWMIALAVVFVLRVSFPLELEWMEGGVLHQALRFQRGQPLYPPPSAEFVPFLYTPLYAMTVGALGWLFGLDYPLARAVSIASTIAIAAAIARAVAREHKPRLHGLVAVGLVCSGYVFGFRWLDVGRPDAMFLALVVWALVLLRESWGDYRKAALAGLLMALAFWTKQTAAVFVIASGVGALLVAPRQLWVYAGVIALVDGGGLWLANRASDGWLWTYVFELHQAHAFNHERFERKTWGMFVHAAPFLTVLGAWLVVRFAWPWLARSRRLQGAQEQRLRARISANRGVLFWTIIALASGLVSALGYSTQWAEPNAFLPGIVFGALWIGVVWPTGGRAEVLAGSLIAAQLVFAAALEPMYQPIQSGGLGGLGDSYAWQRMHRTIPDAAARARAELLRVHLESSAREVFALHRPWWSILAGGDGHVGSMGLADLSAADRRDAEAAILARLRAGEFDELWFEGEPPAWLRNALRGRYKVIERLQGEDRVRPLSGWMSEAGVVTAYVADQVHMAPIVPASVPADAVVLADFEDGTLQGVRTRGGFGRRPVTGFTGELPQPAGYGGEFWLSSAGASGRLEEHGEAELGPIALAPGEAIQLGVARLGRTGATGCEVVVLDEHGAAVATFVVPATNAVIARQQWQAPTAMQVRIVVRDADAAAAIAIDDVWRVRSAP